MGKRKPKGQKRNPSKKPKSLRAVIERPDSVKGPDAVALFDRVALEALHSHRKLFDELSLHEKELVIRWLSDALIDGDPSNAVHNVLWEIDYVRKPVGIETFIMDDYYLGKVLNKLHPLWIEDLKTVFAPRSKISEWILTGGIGTGKTTLAMAAIAYKLYCLSCLKDAPSYYGLLPKSLIVLGIYSITKRQVADTGYFKLRGHVDNSPYFRNDFPRSTKIDSQVDFEKTTGKLIKVIPGSQELHALGLDLFSFSMDEVNFMREKTDKEMGTMIGQAYDLYNATRTRITSRFLRPGGVIPGIMLLMSSRKSQTSFLEERLKKIDRTVTHVSDYALWEVKPATNYTLPWFKVEVGDRIAASRILEPKEKIRPGARIIEVPGEYKKLFQEDVDQNLRDVAGIATFNISPLVRDRKSVFDAVRKSIPKPFARKSVTLDILDDIQLAEFFDMNIACKIFKGKYVPRINPSAPRFGHTDIALTGDSAGIAMGHVSGVVSVERVKDDGTVAREESPFIIIDFMLRITPPPSSEIELKKLRAFWFYILKFYPLIRVTFDGFQSADSMQILKKRGKMESGLLSIDKVDTPYLSLRSAHFDRRIAMYDYTPYQDEVLDLERVMIKGRKPKVDHPTRSSKGVKGSKDVSDAVAGVVWQCVSDERAIMNAPLFSSPVDPALYGRVVDPKDNGKGVNGRPTAGSRQPGVDGNTMDWDKLRDNVHV